LDAVGGAEIATHRLAEHFSQRGDHVTLIGTVSIRQWFAHPSLCDYAKNIHTLRLPVWQRSRRTFARTLAFHATWLFPRLDCEILHLRGLTPETVTLANIARRTCRMKILCVPMASGAYGDSATFGQPHRPLPFDWISTLTEPMRQEI